MIGVNPRSQYLPTCGQMTAKITLNIGSYMSAHVLLNLLNELRKSNKMLGKPHILSLFLNSFNKFNNIGEHMLDSIYHMTLELF